MFAFTASRWQVATYLFGVALFSISFLVFLNSTVSFVITDRIGRDHGVGDAVGTLGFADELVALVGCPIWGMVSDRVGVAKVAVVGYAIVALSLFLFVQASNVYPQLLLGRLLFALGASATTTMVTAVLPAMTHVSNRPPQPEVMSPSRDANGGHNITPSISSELTITPARLNSASSYHSVHNTTTPQASARSTSNLAGLVGMFTGFGALLALAVFLPLPARFQKSGVSPSESVEYSFYIVGTVAFVVAFACMFGLRNLPGEENKSWRNLFVVKEKDESGSAPMLSYPRLLLDSLVLGLKDANIGLGYLGGFVARASSVAISLFIPLFANAYFISHGDCKPGDGKTSDDVKRHCREAYLIASALTGTSQLVALICAPVFGYLAGRYKKHNLPLMLAAVAGIAGYIAFGLLKTPTWRAKDDGSPGVFFIVALLGISQIGAIVCSLGLLGRGITGDEEEIDVAEEEEEQRQRDAGFQVGTHIQSAPASASRHLSRHLDPDATPVPSPSVASASLRDPLLGNSSATSTPTPPINRNSSSSGSGYGESSPLLPSHFRRLPPSSLVSSRAHLKGSIAGVYSLAGGAGILILTKLGGLMFDDLDPGAPFFVMAAFNAILLIAVVGTATRKAVRGYRTRIVMP